MSGMPEHIEREALLQVLEEVGGCDAPPDSWADGWDKGISEAIKFVKELPAADVVEVVRCKDCKYLSKNRFYCEYYKIAIIDNGFCYRGARMDGDTK